MRGEIPVAVIGAGGIGFDVSEFLTQAGESTTLDKAEWLKEWGIDSNNEARGGIAGIHTGRHDFDTGRVL